MQQHKLGRKSGSGQYWRCGDERSRLSHLPLHCSLGVVPTVWCAMLWPYVTFLYTGHCQARFGVASSFAALSLSPCSLADHCVLGAVVWCQCQPAVCFGLDPPLMWCSVTVTFLTDCCLSNCSSLCSDLLPHTCASCPRNGTSSFGG